MADRGRSVGRGFGGTGQVCSVTEVVRKHRQRKMPHRNYEDQQAQSHRSLGGEKKKTPGALIAGRSKVRLRRSG
jgi:hypothetical protein